MNVVTWTCDVTGEAAFDTADDIGQGGKHSLDETKDDGPVGAANAGSVAVKILDELVSADPVSPGQNNLELQIKSIWSACAPSCDRFST